jgi:hypothetical protein
MIKEIDEYRIGEILNKNFGFSLNNEYIDDFGCPVVEFEAKEAFNFVEIINGLSGRSYYFTEDGQVILPIIQPELSLNEPSILDYYHKFPHIFQGRKYLIPFRYNKTMEKKKVVEQTILQKVNSSGLSPRECVITEISYLQGGSLEGFTEYVASKLLANNGYLTENQASFPKAKDIRGIPDIGAYKIPQVQNTLIECGFIDYGGFLHELALLRVFGTISNTHVHEETQSVLLFGESKTGPTSESDFLEKERKYFSGGYCDRFLQITPHKPRFNEYYDYLAFDEDGTARLEWSAENQDMQNKEWKDRRKKELVICIIHKIKSYLLQNLTFNELIDSVDKGKPKTLYEFHENLYSLELKQVAELIRDVVADDRSR